MRAENYKSKYNELIFIVLFFLLLEFSFVVVVVCLLFYAQKNVSTFYCCVLRSPQKLLNIKNDENFAFDFDAKTNNCNYL